MEDIVIIDIGSEEENQHPKRAPSGDARNRGPKEADTRARAAESQAKGADRGCQ